MACISQLGLKNRILAFLTAPEFALIAGDLVQVDLHPGQTLHRAGDAIDHVYFPEAGLISTMAVLADGALVEIGVVGAEGVAGVSVVLGARTSFCETLCQTGAAAHCMPVAALLRAVERAPGLRKLLLLYAHVFSVQAAQTAACDAHHELSQRLARWLLAAHDRSGMQHLALTQDLIAAMLGVRRSTVSVAAGTLQKAGIIQYHHGHISILDRSGLEAAACECYAVVAGEYRNLLPGDVVATASARRTPPSAGDG